MTLVFVVAVGGVAVVWWLKRKRWKERGAANGNDEGGDIFADTNVFTDADHDFDEGEEGDTGMQKKDER